MRVYGPPETPGLATDFEKDLVEQPLVAGTRLATTHVIRVGLAELPTPLVDRLVRHDDTPLSELLFDVTIAETAAVVQLDRVQDDFGGKAEALVWRRRSGCLHAPSNA